MKPSLVLSSLSLALLTAIGGCIVDRTGVDPDPSPACWSDADCPANLRCDLYGSCVFRPGANGGYGGQGSKSGAGGRTGSGGRTGTAGANGTGYGGAGSGSTGGGIAGHGAVGGTAGNVGAGNVGGGTTGAGGGSAGGGAMCVSNACGPCAGTTN